MPLDATAHYEIAGPQLLSMQPPSLDAQPPEGKDWDIIAPQLESRMRGLREWRYSWWQAWASLAEYLLPRRYHFLVVANLMTKGAPLNNAIVDSTATLAMQTCAAGMWSGLTPPTRPWFKLGIAADWIELDDDSKQWLEDAERMLYFVFAQSNFYNTMAQAFQDVATFGTAPIIMYEDSQDVLRCYLPCSGEYYLAVGSRLSVDTLYREFVLTIQQIVDMFGLENCPEQVRTPWEQGGGSLEREMIVAHAIEPNFAMSRRTSGSAKINVVPGHFTWREVYWLRGQQTEKELSRRGFNGCPFFVARWSVVSNDPYGRSPGMDCLGDTKQLQLETRRKGEFIEKLVRPPMGANPEMKNEPSSIQPGNITYSSTEGSKKGFWPLFEVNPAALPPMIEDLKEIQSRIKDCFFVNLFMAITQMQGVQPRNELELTKRDLERLQALGPFVNLFTTEVAAPAVLRGLDICQRRRLLKPMPPALMGMPLKVDCVSMMKIAQAAAENTGIASVIASGIQMSQGAREAGAPDPLDNIDMDEALRITAENGQIRSKVIRSVADVAKIRVMKAKAAQQAATTAGLAGAAKIAPSAVSAAKGLSEIDPRAGALGAMLGGTSNVSG
jgi:hypothetical protein